MNIFHGVELTGPNATWEEWKYFDGFCPYCAAQFNTQVQWAEHVDACEMNEPAFPQAEDED